MKLYILYRRALDRLGRLFEDALGEDDALDREPRGPLGHLFADLFWGDGEESLDRVRALAKVKENHLAPLRARCLDAGAEEDRLPVHGPVKLCDLRARVRVEAGRDSVGERRARTGVRTRRGTYGKKAVLFAVLAHLLLGDGRGRRRVGRWLGDDARAVVLRGDVRGCELGHGAGRGRLARAKKGYAHQQLSWARIRRRRRRSNHRPRSAARRPETGLRGGT